jgi:superfamily I DNA/RNA helicase
MNKATPSYLEGLNPPQLEAASHTEGPLLVLAGAGSGKTRVITHRITHIIAQGLAKPSQILALTFTNKAAEEMRTRVGKLVGPALAKGIMLTTFHAFCVRVLRAHIAMIGYRKDFTICSEGDMRTMLRRVLNDIDGPKESFSPSMFQAEISLHKNTHLYGDEEEKEPSPPPVKKDGKGESETEKKYRVYLPEILERYQMALRAANTVDFDDLLLLTLSLWREHPEILDKFQKHYRYVLVDEYQDTNKVQYAILRALVGERHNLCVVGDDDQSIYGWRGADIKNILEFERDFPNAKIVTLDQNYRSTETILKAANAVIANNKKRRAKRLWSNLGAGRPIEWIVTGDEEHEAKTILEWLELIRSKSNASFTDFAILYRSNLQSRPIEITLRQAGVPYVVVGGQEFFERAEVKDIIAYLKIIANPRDEASFLRVVNMPRRGIGDTALNTIHAMCLENSLSLRDAMLKAIEYGKVSESAAAGIKIFNGLVSDFRKRFREREAPLKQILNDMIEASGYRAELSRTCKTPGQFEQRWDNVQAVVRAVDAFEQNSPAPTLWNFLDESALASDEDRRSKEKRRQSGVTLMTIHSAKGLEFPFVFIAGCEERLLPHDKSVRESGFDDAGIEEERRLFYVALTRGKRHVTLFEALSRNRFGRDAMTETSRFLKEIPEELMHKRIRAARDMVEERVAPNKPDEKAKAKKKSAAIRAKRKPKA